MAARGQRTRAPIFTGGGMVPLSTRRCSWRTLQPMMAATAGRSIRAFAGGAGASDVGDMGTSGVCFVFRPFRRHETFSRGSGRINSRAVYSEGEDTRGREKPEKDSEENLGRNN